MKILNIFLFLIFVNSLTSCTKTTTIRRSEAYTSFYNKSQNIALLPVLVQINKIDIAGKKIRQHDFEYAVENISEDVLLEQLKGKGLKVRFVSKKEIHDIKSSKEYLIASELYSETINRLYTPIAMEEKLAFAIKAPLDKRIETFCSAINSHFLIFTEYYVRSKTSAANTANFVASLFIPKNTTTPDDYAEYGELRLGIIDCNNPSLIWSNYVAEGYGVFSGFFGGSAEKVEKKRLENLAKLLLNPLDKK